MSKALAKRAKRVQEGKAISQAERAQKGRPPGKVVCQKWEESERGWGCRPDGYSLHISEADRKAYVQEYWNDMPASAPDEYSRPCGTPYECEVDKSTYAKVSRSKNGVRFNSNTYPGSGGDDGWR